MKRLTYFALTLCLTTMIGCGGDTNTATSSSDNGGRSNVGDQIARRTSVDDGSTAAPESARDDRQATRGPSNGRDEFEGRGRGPEGSDTRADAGQEAAADSSPASPPDPNAFSSALFPNGKMAADSGEQVGDDVGRPADGGEGARGQIAGTRSPGRGAPDLGDRGGPPGRRDGPGRGDFDDPNLRGRGEAGTDLSANDSGEEESEEAAEDQPLTLLAQAKRRFLEHDEEQAIKLIYAHHLVSDEARSKYSLNWFNALKEPRLLLRLGVGIVFNAPKDFDGRHPVIGDPGDPNEGATRNSNSGDGRGRRDTGGLAGFGGASRGSRAYKNVDTSRPDGYMLYYTGEFGEAVIREYEERRKSKSTFGQILTDVMEIELPDNEAEKTAANRRGGRGGRGRGTIAPVGGTVAGTMGDSGGGRGSRSQTPKDTTILDAAMGRGTAQKPDNEEFSGSIRPGVLLLGVGSKKELLERAKSANVDSLITFNVKITKPRRANNPPTNTTSVKIIDLKGENEQIFSSRSLKDTTVEEKREDGEEPVEKEVERLFKVIDSDFAAGPLPSAINADNVKKRIGRLLKTSKDNPLPAAVEIVAFYQSKMLSEDLAKTAVIRLFGSDDANVLISGDESARLGFLAPWLPDGIVE